jgi:hypothetical protein
MLELINLLVFLQYFEGNNWLISVVNCSSSSFTLAAGFESVSIFSSFILPESTRLGF